MKSTEITKSDFDAALPPVDHEGQTLIDARSLHAWLGVLDRFHMWMTRRLEEYGFSEGSDFCAISRKNGGRGRPRQDYLITIDMAKELSMVERTEKGRATRRYFIEMEKAAHEMAVGLIGAGRDDLIPDRYFDAQAAIAGLEDRIMSLLDSRLPAKPTIDLSAPWMKARDLIDHLGLTGTYDAPKFGWELTKFMRDKMGLEPRKIGGIIKTNMYPAEAVAAFMEQR